MEKENTMKKNLLGKKVKFAMLLTIASVIGLQVSEADSQYRIYCPERPYREIPKADGLGHYKIYGYTMGGLR
jgi:hypothetical protein